MKRTFILAIVLSAMAGSLLAQTGNNSTPSIRVPNHIDVNDRSGNIAMVGDAEIASEIGISLEDHLISGVQWKVTDNEIDLSGVVPNKLDKKTAHEIAEAYADGRKVRDHVKENVSAKR